MHSRVLGATEARVHFGELMRRVVARHEPLIVEDVTGAAGRHPGG